MIFNGVDTRQFSSADEIDLETRRRVRAELGASDTQVLVGLIGRLDPRKGQQWLIRAAGKLAASGREICIALVGASEQDYRAELEKQVLDMGLESVVKFTGHRTDSRDVYASLDILAVPSYEEAFGLVAVEGMLSGLPVVASNSGALPEFVEHGTNGLMVELNDDGALAEAIARLADNAELRAEIGSRARDWARNNLEMNLVLDRLDELYDRCIK